MYVSTPGTLGPVRQRLTHPPGGRPECWCREEVMSWLAWCEEEYALTNLNTNSFSINGKALCMLTKADFCERAPGIGDVLYNTLQKFLHQSTPSAFPLHGDHYDAHGIRAIASKLDFPACYPSAYPTQPNYSSFYVNTSTATSPAPQGPHIPVTSTFPVLSPFLTPASSPTETQHDVNHTQSGVTCTQSDAQLSEKPLDLKINPRQGSLDICQVTSSVVAASRASEQTTMPSFRVTLPHGVANDEAHARSSILPDLGKHSYDMPASSPSTRCGFLPSFMQSSLQTHSASAHQLKTADDSKTNGDCRLLWEFLHDLLSDEQHAECIRWEEEEKLTFRILSPNQLAQLWGIQKNKGNMTYEKLSRALRYYYKMDIIAKVPGRRLTYKFLKHPRKIKRGIRGARPGVPHHRRNHKDSIKAYIKNAVPNNDAKPRSDEQLSRGKIPIIEKEDARNVEDMICEDSDRNHRLPLLNILEPSPPSSPDDDSLKPDRDEFDPRSRYDFNHNVNSPTSCRKLDTGIVSELDKKRSVNFGPQHERHINIMDCYSYKVYNNCLTEPHPSKQMTKDGVMEKSSKQAILDRQINEDSVGLNQTTVPHFENSINCPNIQQTSRPGSDLVSVTAPGNFKKTEQDIVQDEAYVDDDEVLDLSMNANSHNPH